MPITKEPCHKTEIVVQVDSVTGSGGDVVEVELTETQSGESFLKQTLQNTIGGSYAFEFCLKEGYYEFEISDSGGNGFDQCTVDACGYAVVVGK